MISCSCEYPKDWAVHQLYKQSTDNSNPEALLLRSYDNLVVSPVSKRKWRDRKGSSGRWPGYVMSTKVIFSPAEVSFFWRKSVPRDVRMQSRVAFRFFVTPRPPLHETFAFLPNIRQRLAACGRLGRQPSARLKITFVDMVIPRAGPGASLSVPSFTLAVSHWRRAAARIPDSMPVVFPRVGFIGFRTYVISCFNKTVSLPAGINLVLSQDFNDQRRPILAVFELHT